MIIAGSIQPVNYPELIIGLVGAVGTDLQAVNQVLRNELSEVDYQSLDIKLSGLLNDSAKYGETLKNNSNYEDDRIDYHMDAGDDLRKSTGSGDALVCLAIAKIRDEREKRKDATNVPLSKTAFILNSLKQPEEIYSLRKIYGKSFFLLSVYSPRSERKNNLAKKIAASHHEPTKVSQYFDVAERLIEKDQNSGFKEFGQNVQKAFPLGDFFLEAGNKDEIRREVRRFIELVFSHPFRTPSSDEYAMFHAFAASLRSADLSRQVGAVITSKEGALISVGCNEVPKAGGGFFWEGEANDYRDFNEGFDASAKIKKEIVDELINRLSEHKLLANKKGLVPSELVNQILYGKKKVVLEGTRITDILEFGRIVHAEMAAITDAALRGVSLKGATLYCTTFPCHMCARHIIASGINRVVFVEPYPKSLAKDLYKRSISVDREKADDDAVIFEPFVGVSWKRFLDFYTACERKDEQGNCVNWDKKSASPRLEIIYPAYLEIELAIVNLIEKNRKRFGISKNCTKWKRRTKNAKE